MKKIQAISVVVYNMMIKTKGSNNRTPSAVQLLRLGTFKHSNSFPLKEESNFRIWRLNLS